MTLKNIISKFRPKQKEEPKTFLAVEITSETIKSALWTVEAAKTEIIKIGSLQEWDGENKDLLLAAVDKSISNACEKTTSEPEGMIFGLPRSWIKDDQIIEEKKELLKFICQRLELKPLGFVANLEALIAYLKIKEGTPVNAIFINLQETQSLISLVQVGKIKATKIVGRSDDLAADVREGLSRFKKIENLPARMIIFNGTVDLEEYKQQLTSFDWMEKLSFLHFPQVESLSVNKTIEAVAIAGGSEVAKSLGFKIEEKRKEEVVKDKKKATLSAQKKPSDLSAAKPSSSDQLADTKSKEVTASDLGFVADQDVVQIKKEATVEEKAEIKKEEEPEIKQPKIKKQKSFPQPLALIPKLTSLFKKFILNFRFLFLGKKKQFIFVILTLCLGLVFAGAIAFYRYVPKAKVIIYLAPKTLEKELEIIVDAGTAQIDLESKTIPGEQKSVIVEDKKTTSTSGEKIVGDKAKGEVIIYNKTDLGKNFASGTILIGPDNLKFTLDEEIEVASRSAEEEGISYGKATAAVSAASIGTESNLAGGSNFTFKDYSDSLFSAKTEAGLSGGTSRQIKAVSAEDINSLLEELEEELIDQAETKLKKELAPEKKILTEKENKEVLIKDFSAEKGDEADLLELKLKIKFLSFVYDQGDLDDILAESIKDTIPADFILDRGKTEVEVKETQIDKDKIKITALVKAYLLPKIDFADLKKNLVGRHPEETQDYLQKLPNFTRADIEITPNLPVKFKTLPRLSKNIIIETKIEE